VAERPDQIEQRIASTRHELGNNLHELEHKVKQAADWRTYYERNPMTMVGVAFGGGVLLASLMGGRRGRNDAPYVTQVPRSAGYLTGAKQRDPASDLWQNVKAALIGLSGAKLRGFLDEALPGFSEHYDRFAHANSGTSTAAQHSQSREQEVPSHRM
jgi:hypothetical protein